MPITIGAGWNIGPGFAISSTSTSTGIVTANLALSLDAGNPASYSGTGSTWYDLSGNGNNLTLQNSPVWNSSGYFTLNGTNQYALLNSPPANLINWYSSGFSVCYWVYANTFVTAGTGGAGGGIGNSNATDNINYLTFGTYNLGVSGGVPSIYYYNGSQSYGSATIYIPPPPPAVWTHLAFVQSGGVVTYYVNSVAAGTTTISGTPQSNAAYPLTFGAQANSYLDGRIYAAQIYTAALTAGQVLQNYTAQNRF
jgi:hypothetical protein